MKACAQTMMLLGAALVAGDQAAAKDVYAFWNQSCPRALQAVYADMHDGDKKQVTIDGTSLTIKPSGNNQKWVVKSRLDRKSCSASIDFNVPGKPGPPPVNLQATFWFAASVDRAKTMWGFTDPSGTLADARAPLNRWVQIEPRAEPQRRPVCTIGEATAVYADMHDGDKKEITIDGTGLTIKPSGNNQTWVVHSTVDYDSCSATIDFNVPGKPGPRSVKLLATLLAVGALKDSGTDPRYPDDSSFRYEFEFTHPRYKNTPVNHWVEIGDIGAAGLGAIVV